MIFLWLFLPPISFDLPWNIKLNREDLIRWLPGVILFPLLGRRVVRWHILDLPMVLFCLCPLVCGLVNGISVAESLNECRKELLYWFVPYWIGRQVLTNRKLLEHFAWILIAGAFLLLIPTVYEVYHGPVIAGWFTGVQSLAWRGADRGITFRPAVFFPTGFVLTMFYAWASLLLGTFAKRHFMRWYYSDRCSNFAPVEVWPGVLHTTAAMLLLIIVFACKSLGSIVLGTIGLLSRWIISARYQRSFCLILVVVPASYICLRVTGICSTERIVTIAKQLVSETKAGSLGYRLQAEDLAIQRVSNRWWFGYGTWGGWAETGTPLALDGFWLFCLTRTGMVSVLLWLAMVMTPVLCLICDRKWNRFAEIEGAFVLFICLSMIDGLFNYFSEAPLLVCVGAITTMAINTRAPILEA